MRLKSFLLIEQFHAYRTVWDLISNNCVCLNGKWQQHSTNYLFIWMPRTEMSEQVMLLVEIKGAYKALEGSPDKWMVSCKSWSVIGLSPLLMESLHVSQEQSSLRKCLRALRTLTCFQLVSMFACSVLFILPFQVKHFMAFFTREAPVECFVRKNPNVNSYGTYFCIWNFWCLFSCVSEGKVLLQMGQRNCIPLLLWEEGSSWGIPLAGLFKFDFSFWRKFLRDRFFFFKPPFPACSWSWEPGAAAFDPPGSSAHPRAILTKEVSDEKKSW